MQLRDDGLLDLFHRRLRRREHLRAAVGKLSGQAQIACKDYDALREIDCLTLGVRHSPVVQDLQKFVQNACVCLFDLIKEKDRKRMGPYGVGQLSARVIADVSGRRSQKPLVRVTLAVFGHVKPDQGALCAEYIPRKGLGQLCFARSCGARKEQDAPGPAAGGMLESGHTRGGSGDHIGDSLHGLWLADHIFGQLPV